ncbi:hypothetical protein F5148DRAFT_147344 [Russula earlei]|uniref:Uncharacterized protein n=1 Tax=Russula earlei TaxID=71964 RepID=A0ACC0U712_9AGAM|nr:hypothetical protein F5148DRAFT_147344 [Russula earlei]
MRCFTLAFALVAASLQTALSFLETSPLVAWSSHRSSALDRLRLGSVSTSATPHANDLFSKLLTDTGVCEFDAVIIVNQPRLHASDLRSLPPSSSLATRLQDSPSSIQFPYVRFPLPKQSDPSPFQELADKVAVLCDAQPLSSPIGDTVSSSERGTVRVLQLSMPAVTESAGARKRSVADHEARLATELDKIARAFPRHLVIMAGSPRQDDPVPPPSPAPPAGGILARYQLLTPALITSLILAFFVLVPIVLYGISALASIQSPLRVQPPKGFSADEKKNQ